MKKIIIALSALIMVTMAIFFIFFFDGSNNLNERNHEIDKSQGTRRMEDSIAEDRYYSPDASESENDGGLMDEVGLSQDAKRQSSTESLQNVEESTSLYTTIVKKQSYNIPIYMMLSRYGQGTIDQLLESGIQSGRLLTASNIDPKNTNKFDERIVKAFVDKAVSNKDDAGIFIIDWEKQLYDDLKLAASNKKFIAAEKEYVRLIKYIKSLRPNLRVGVYGLPFRVYESKTRNINGDGLKFTGILKHCDIITPSFYFMQTDEEVGKDKNLLIFKNNTEISLEYGAELNKPVVPFIWEIVHPNNKKFGGQLVPLTEFSEIMKFVSNHSYKGQKIQGFFWWTPHRLPNVYKSVLSNDTRFLEEKNEIKELIQSVSNANEARDVLTVEYVKGAFGK